MTPPTGKEKVNGKNGDCEYNGWKLECELWNMNMNHEMWTRNVKIELWMWKENVIAALGFRSYQPPIVSTHTRRSSCSIRNYGWCLTQNTFLVSEEKINFFVHDKDDILFFILISNHAKQTDRHTDPTTVPSLRMRAEGNDYQYLASRILLCCY